MASGRAFLLPARVQRLAAEQLGIMVAGRAPGEYVDDLRVFLRYALNVLVVHMRPRIMLRMPDYRRAKKRIFELGQRMIDSYDPSYRRRRAPTSASHGSASLTDNRMSQMRSRRPQAGSDEYGNRPAA